MLNDDFKGGGGEIGGDIEGDSGDIEGIERAYAEKASGRRRVNLSFALRGVEFFDLEQASIEEGARIGAGTYIGPGAIIAGAASIGAGCTIGQGTIIAGATSIGAGCAIGQGCRIEGCEIADGVTVEHSVLTDSSVGADTHVGPFAYVRPGSRIGCRCKIGDFVEVKNSVLGDDVKVSHLTYIGDSDLGSGINVGCGVVFVNYDGRDKHRSTVGDGAFIGCNVNIVSPVRIGPGAYIAAGGTVVRDVPAGALFVARDRGRSIEGWVERRGLLKSRLKKKGG